MAEEVTQAEVLAQMAETANTLEEVSETVIGVKRTVETKAEEITASNAAAPVPVWDGTQLKFVKGNDQTVSLTEFVDLKGAKGDKGDTGNTGAPGADGNDGSDGVTPTLQKGSVTTLDPGSDATVTMTQNGTVYTLSFGIPKGAKGDKGETGEKGDTGATGATGAQGPQGPKGDTGSFDASDLEDYSTTVIVKDMLREEIEHASGGRCTIVRDAFGSPHHFYVVPKFNLGDVVAGLSGVHPMFNVNGVVKSEILIGRYKASFSAAGHLQTLPHKDPAASKNHDEFVALARELGSGFSVCGNTSHAGVGLMCAKILGTDHVYKCNNNYGRDATNHEQTGVLSNGGTPGDTGNHGNSRTLTGSGPKEWNHDETDWGIADFCGNVWEWCPGLRIKNGEIQVIPDNDVMIADADLSDASNRWKAIDAATGNLVAPGSAGTLKIDGVAADTQTSWKNAGACQFNTEVTNANVKGYYGKNFKELGAASGVNIPDILKAYGIAPIANDLLGYFTACNIGDRLAFRGGYWGSGTAATPFYLHLTIPRTNSSTSIGCRLAFLP